MFEMSEAKPAKAPNTLLHSDTLTRVLGADAMQILRCGICMNFFEVPIVLPCGHTFCLHCLTKVCKHASLNHAPNSAQDARIGCPNCRVLIYATPILRRNVTCNFIIQSLIECLRVREDRRSPTHSQGVNTDDDQTSTCPWTQPAPDDDHDDEEMIRALNDFDRMTKTLARANIVDNSFLEIEEIRREHLARERRRQAERDARTRDQVRFVKNIMKQSREEQNIQQQQNHQQHQQPQQQQQQRQILPRPQQPNQNQRRPENQTETTQLLGKSPFPISTQSENFLPQPKQSIEQQLQNNTIHHHQHQQVQQSQRYVQQPFQHHLQAQHQHLNPLIQQQKQQKPQQHHQPTLSNHQSAIQASQSVPRLNNPSTSVKVASMAVRPLPLDTLPGPAGSPDGVPSIPSGQTDIKATPSDCVHLNNDPAVMSFSLVTNTPSIEHSRTLITSTSTSTKSSGHLGTLITSAPSNRHLESSITSTPSGGHLGSLIISTPSSGHLGSLITSEPSSGHVGSLVISTPSSGLLESSVTSTPSSGHVGTLVTCAPSSGHLGKPS